MLMWSVPGGGELARSGWASAIFWVLGMGLRFAFLIWITHGGAAATARFSAAHAITSKEAWTVALLAMAVAEVTGRSAVQAIRRHHLTDAALATLAHAAWRNRPAGTRQHRGCLFAVTQLDHDPGGDRGMRPRKGP